MKRNISLLIAVALAAMPMALGARTAQSARGAGTATPAALAEQVAALIFRSEADQLRKSGRGLVERELFSRTVGYIVVGRPNLCDPRQAECRTLAQRALAPEVDRIMRDLPARAERKLATILAAMPVTELRAYRAGFLADATERDRQDAAAGAALLAGAGVLKVIDEEALAVRPKVARATAHLPRRATPPVPPPAATVTPTVSPPGR